MQFQLCYQSGRIGGSKKHEILSLKTSSLNVNIHFHFMYSSIGMVVVAFDIAWHPWTTYWSPCGDISLSEQKLRSLRTRSASQKEKGLFLNATIKSRAKRKPITLSSSDVENIHS